MANEITASASLSVNKGNVQVSAAASKAADMAGSEMILNLQTIGESAAELVVLGDIGTAAYIFFRNTDATNFVELALDSGMSNKFAKLLPGDITLIKSVTNAIYAKADTAAVALHVAASEL